MARKIRRLIQRLCKRCGHKHRAERPCMTRGCGCKRLVLRGGKTQVTRLRRNPTLLTFGNPLTVLTNDVIEIRYRHKEDGKLYKHAFQKGQVRIRGSAGSKTAVMERLDGKPLLGDY